MATLHLDPLPRNATAGEVLRFVCDTAGIDGKLVGKITFLAKGATVELPDSHAAKAVAALDGTAFRERRVRARFAAPPRTDAPHDPFGITLKALVIGQEDVGLGGRLLLTFSRKGNPGPLPPNRLQSGAPVLLTQTGVNRPVSLRGVVLERVERTITVAFEEPDDD